MHCVVPIVGCSLAFEDPYQEMVLDPRVKKHNEFKKLYTLQKPVSEVAGPAPLHSYTPIRKLNDEQTKLRIVSSDRGVQ